MEHQVTMYCKSDKGNYIHRPDKSIIEDEGCESNLPSLNEKLVNEGHEYTLSSSNKRDCEGDDETAVQSELESLTYSKPEPKIVPRRNNLPLRKEKS